MCKICEGIIGVCLYAPHKFSQYLKMLSEILGVKVYESAGEVPVIVVDYGEAGLHVIDVANWRWKYGNDETRKLLSVMTPI